MCTDIREWAVIIGESERRTASVEIVRGEADQRGIVRVAKRDHVAAGRALKVAHLGIAEPDRDISEQST
jgi:hypothetical protein